MINGMVARLAADLAGPDVALFDLTPILRTLEPKPNAIDYHSAGVREAFEVASRLGSGAPLAIFLPNYFATRRRGKDLIERVLPYWDLTHVLELGGAYIPGHGQPTMLLVARAQMPTSETVLVLRCVLGEPRTPERPELGVVWRSVLQHARQPGGDEWVRSALVPREALAVHPWCEETEDAWGPSCGRLVP